MSGYVQSVVVEGKLFIGGGWADRDDNNYRVMGYDLQTKKWDTLPPYNAKHFAMTVINNMIVLVGGYTGSQHSNKLGVWGSDSKQWTHPYPDMPITCCDCSAVVYCQWLVVAGGFNRATLEVLNYDTKQWYSSSPTPTILCQMKTAIVGDTCYFIGGHTGHAYGTPTSGAYSLSIPAVISQFDPGHQATGRQIWKEISPLQTTFSTPRPRTQDFVQKGMFG